MDRTRLIAIVDSKDGLYHVGDTATLVQDCGYTSNVILDSNGHLCAVVSANWRVVVDAKSY